MRQTMKAWNAIFVTKVYVAKTNSSVWNVAIFQKAYA